jgi:hypothetical protein
LFGIGNRTGSCCVVSLNAEKFAKRVQNNLIIVDDKEIGFEHGLTPVRIWMMYRKVYGENPATFGGILGRNVAVQFGE